MAFFIAGAAISLVGVLLGASVASAQANKQKERNN